MHSAGYRTKVSVSIDNRGREAPGIGNSRCVCINTPHLIDRHLAKVLTKCNRNFTFSERTLTKPREDFLIVLKQAGAGESHLFSNTGSPVLVYE